MKFEYHNFYHNGNEKRLKGNYLLAYSYSPGLMNKLVPTNLFVNDNFEYDLFLFYGEFNGEKFEPNKPLGGIHFSQHSLLPKHLRSLLSKLISADFTPKKSYCLNTDGYRLLDIKRRSCGIRCKGKYTRFDLSPDIVDWSQFTTDHEKDFVKLVNLLEDWLDKWHDVLIEQYTFK